LQLFKVGGPRSSHFFHSNRADSDILKTLLLSSAVFLKCPPTQAAISRLEDGGCGTFLTFEYLMLSWLVMQSSSLRAGAFINEKPHQAFSASGMKVVYPMGRSCKTSICSLIEDAGRS
jgi:hypothetical protein